MGFTSRGNSFVSAGGRYSHNPQPRFASRRAPGGSEGDAAGSVLSNFINSIFFTHANYLTGIVFDDDAEFNLIDTEADEISVIRDPITSANSWVQTIAAIRPPYTAGDYFSTFAAPDRLQPSAAAMAAINAATDDLTILALADNDASVTSDVLNITDTNASPTERSLLGYNRNAGADVLIAHTRNNIQVATAPTIANPGVALGLVGGVFPRNATIKALLDGGPFTAGTAITDAALGTYTVAGSSIGTWQDGSVTFAGRIIAVGFYGAAITQSEIDNSFLPAINAYITSKGEVALS